MNKRILTYVLLFSLIFNISFISIFIYKRWIEHPVPRMLHNMDNSFRPPNKKPPFSKEEWEKLHDMREKIQPEIEVLMNAIRQERRALGMLLLQDNPDSTIVDDKLNKIAKLQNKIEHKITFHLLKQKEMLPDSLKKALIHSVINRYQFMNPRRHGPGDHRRPQ